MLEYVYKLNLPSIREVLLPGKYEEIFAPSDAVIFMRSISSWTYLKPEHQIVNGYTMDHSLLFYKAGGAPGVVHDDGDTVWALNYIVGGYGKLCYYDRSKLGEPEIMADPVDNYRPVYKDTNLPPDRTYYMSPGVYLVRTDQPHLPYGYGKRYSLSIRAIEEQLVLPWETVVDSFKEYII